MSGLLSISFRKLARALVRLGFKPVRQSGSHMIFKHPDGRATVVPNHAREDIGPGLLRKILKDANVDPSTFREKL